MYLDCADDNGLGYSLADNLLSKRCEVALQKILLFQIEIESAKPNRETSG